MIFRIVADCTERRDTRELAVDGPVEGLPVRVGGPAWLIGAAAACRAVFAVRRRGERARDKERKREEAHHSGV